MSSSIGWTKTKSSKIRTSYPNNVANGEDWIERGPSQNISKPSWMKVISHAFRHGKEKLGFRRGHATRQALGTLPDTLSPKSHNARSERIRRLTNLALGSEDYTSVLELPDDEAQTAADLLQAMLDSPSLDPLVDDESPVKFPRTKIRSLMLELALKRRQVPVSLFLKNVISVESESRASGGFSDIYYGQFTGQPVALKCLRIYLMSSESHKTKLTLSFYRESVLWRNLKHRHVLPFFGITGDVFPSTLCMVLPWMPKGSIRHYISTLKDQGTFRDQAYVENVNRWLYEVALGLSYLHDEDIVHGDLRGANILVDENEHVRLADFGLSVITHSTGTSAPIGAHGGSARWQAPELLDPERFALGSKPTFASDVYAFGIVCVELYTCQTPYAGFMDSQVFVRVLRGDRPTRPITGLQMSDPMWSLATRCWSSEPASRPSADDVVHSLLRITGKDASSSLYGTPSNSTETEENLDYTYMPDGIPLALRLASVQRLHDTPVTGSDTADVFLGRYEGSLVALKRFRIFMNLEHERRLHRIFYKEALKWKDLQHRNVLPFLGIDFTEFSRSWCVVTPWMTHGSIRTFLQRLRDSNLFDVGSMHLNKWLAQTAKGLAYLHGHQIVHGNLWGRNIMVDSDWTVRLADYGQTFIVHAETASASPLGGVTASEYSTATSVHSAEVHRWMAPELLDPETSDQLPTYASDVYAFGCVCVELYVCHNPFREISSNIEFLARMLNRQERLIPKRPRCSEGAIAEMSDELWDLLGQCWAGDAPKRPGSHKVAQFLTKFMVHPRSYRDD